MARLTDRTVLYFTAGPVASAPEKAAAALLEGTIKMRNGALAAATLYGARIEPCDAVAGAPIPTAYNGKPVATPNDASLPVTSAVLKNGDTVSVRRSTGADGHNASAVVAAGAITGVNLAATVTMIDSGDTLTGVAPTGTYTNTVTFTVAAGVITAITLS
jgi:hypothetical protein